LSELNAYAAVFLSIEQPIIETRQQQHFRTKFSTEGIYLKEVASPSVTSPAGFSVNLTKH